MSLNYEAQLELEGEAIQAVYDFCDDWVGSEEEIEEETTYGFDDEEEAVMALYDMLFDSKLEQVQPTVYKALRYLIWRKGINHVYQEIVDLSEEFRELTT